MSPEKEINFFNYNYDKGINWYQHFFDKAVIEKIIGEFSPTYLSSVRVARIMSHVLPDVKLIVSIRNPVEQIYSRYLYMISRQMYKKSFEEALQEKPFLVEDAFYYRHIMRYLDYFERNQILVMIYEDLKVDARGFLKKIYNFLNVCEIYVPKNLNEKYHFSRIPKLKSLETFMVYIRKFLGKARLYSVTEKLKKKGIDKIFKKINTNHNQRPLICDEGIRSQLNDIFYNDKEMLAKLLGRNLDFWK